MRHRYAISLEHHITRTVVRASIRRLAFRQIQRSGFRAVSDRRVVVNGGSPQVSRCAVPAGFELRMR